MAAPEGNQYYLLRNTDGRDLIFKDPKQLAESCNEYFQWCIDNPLQSEEIHSTKMGLERVMVNKVRAFTLLGMCNFIGISKRTFDNYCEREGFLLISTRVRDLIYTQKFENAAAGLLKDAFIARDLGLKDAKDIDHKNDGGKFTGESKVIFEDYEGE